MKNKKNLIWIIACILVAIAAVIMAFTITKNHNNEQNTNKIMADITTTIKEPETTTKKEKKKEKETTTQKEEEITEYVEPETETEYIEPETYIEETEAIYVESDGGHLTPEAGMFWYGDHYEVYYSENVLPGGGLNIPGRYTDENGIVRDENGYVVLAADYSYAPYGSIVDTSWGTGKVYDTGTEYGYIELYTAW